MKPQQDHLVALLAALEALPPEIESSHVTALAAELRASLEQQLQRPRANRAPEPPDADGTPPPETYPPGAPTALRGEIDAMRRSDTSMPLRPRILDGLAVSAQTPTELARAVGSSREVVARVLRALQTDGFITHAADAHDGRKRVYSLTPLGGAQRGLHHSYAETTPAPALDDAALHRRLQRAIELAVGHRRQTNRLQDVADRLTAVLRTAQQAPVHDLAITARAELIATYRQLGDEAAIAPHLAQLRRIAAGEADGIPARFALLASAHVAYEEGRLGLGFGRPGLRADDDSPANRDVEFRHRAVALAQATTEFERCGETHLDLFQYRSRAGWAQLSYANLLRVHTNRIEAIEAAEDAKRTFAAFDDEYGLCRSEFLIGFCLRLGGYFPAAHRLLTDSLARATEHGFARFIADTLTQLGDVERQRQNHDSALELLLEADTRASSMQMAVTRGFAQSAIGATYFGIEDRDLARRHLKAALKTFAPTGHIEGIALTNRRLAALERADSRDGAARTPLKTAEQQYSRLLSPAGVLGCKLEALALASSSSRAAIEADVIGMLRPGSRDRSLVEQDPWTPQLLLQGSKRVDSVALMSLAEAIDASAQQRFTESGGRLGLSCEDVGAYPREADAMAGEPMRKFNHRVAVVA